MSLLYDIPFDPAAALIRSDPQPSEVTLARPAVAVRVDARMQHLFAGRAEVLPSR